MKKVYFGTLIVLSSVCGFLAGCSNDETSSSATAASGSTTNSGSLGPSTPTGTITADGFFMLYDPAIPAVYNDKIQYTQQEVVVTVFADDFNDLIITSGQTINFKTQWGTFVDSDSCVITDGHCSVTWRSGDPATSPTNCVVNFTAWTTGEETFFDANDNKRFDQTETFADLEEPFLDINNNGTFDAGIFTSELIGEFIDIINFTGSTPGVKDGIHNTFDGMYTGSLCATGNTQCTTNQSMVIHTRSYIWIQEPFDEDATVDINGNGVSGEKDILFCG